jgi:hypothetical protein
MFFFFKIQSFLFYLGWRHVDWMCEEQKTYSIHSFFVRQRRTTNSIGQNTAKASVIQVIHVASLDHTYTGTNTSSSPARTIV